MEIRTRAKNLSDPREPAGVRCPRAGSGKNDANIPIRGSIAPATPFRITLQSLFDCQTANHSGNMSSVIPAHVYDKSS
jgi:hypothetical protein